MAKEKTIPECTFGYLLREARKKAGYTQTELAEIAWTTTTHMHKLEVSETLPNLDTICKLCVVLDISPNDLLCEDVKRWKEIFGIANTEVC